MPNSSTNQQLHAILDTAVEGMIVVDDHGVVETFNHAAQRMFGYIMKQEAPPVMLAAIRKVLAGQVHISEKMGATLLQRLVGGGSKNAPATLPMDRLTDRELEIFRMIGEGNTVKEIANQLFLSPKTVEAHREHIKTKLNLRTSAELLRFAIRNSPGAQGA